MLFVFGVNSQEHDQDRTARENFHHDELVATAPYNSYGDYGIFLGNFAVPDCVSGDYATYDQRRFELLTLPSKNLLYNSLKVADERDRFLFYSTKSVPNLIRTLARLIVEEDDIPKVEMSKSILKDVLKNRSVFLKKILPDDFILSMQELASKLAKPGGIDNAYHIISENDPFKNALLERIYIQTGVAKYTSELDFIAFLENMINLLQLMDIGKSTSIRLTPDYIHLLGFLISHRCIASVSEGKATKKFLLTLMNGRRDLYIGLWFYMNVTPTGLECLQTIGGNEFDQFFNRMPSVFFFPRIQQPVYPLLYLVHAPTFNKRRSSKVGPYTFESINDTNAMPLASGHSVIDQLIDTPMRLHVNLTMGGSLLIESDFKVMIFRLREISRGLLTLEIGEAQQMQFPSSFSVNINADQSSDGDQIPRWSMEITDIKLGDFIGLWNGEVDLLPKNFMDLVERSWGGARREMLLQIAAAMQVQDFFHVMLIEGQPKHHRVSHN